MAPYYEDEINDCQANKYDPNQGSLYCFQPVGME